MLISDFYDKLSMLLRHGFEETDLTPLQTSVADCQRRLAIGGYPVTIINTAEIGKRRIFLVFADGEGKKRIIGHGDTILSCYQDALRQARERWVKDNE